MSDYDELLARADKMWAGDPEAWELAQRLAAALRAALASAEAGSATPGGNDDLPEPGLSFEDFTAAEATKANNDVR
jgi:hypothetical protein